MTLLLDGEVVQRVPLRTDTHGVIRVAGTRIPLDAIVDAHRPGQTPEDIVASYDSLQLADVYAAISYYLAHEEEVQEYLSQREQVAQGHRSQIEADPRVSRLRTRFQGLKAEQQAVQRDSPGGRREPQR